MADLVSGLRRLQRKLRYLSGYFETPTAGLPPCHEAGTCQTPVLLINGFLSTPYTFEVLARRLQRDGCCVFPVDFGGFTGRLDTRGIDDLAEEVRMMVDELYARHPDLPLLTVIGFSQGGLVGAYYVKKLGGWRHTRTLITLGSPHNGTAVAYAALPLGLLTRSLWQMMPMSRFLRRLQRGGWPPSVRFSSLYSKQDQIAPFPSALIETHGIPYLRNVQVEAHGHREFLYKKRVYDVILSELRASEAATPLQLGKLSLVPGAARADG